MKTQILAETTPIAREPSVAERDELLVYLWTGQGHPFPLSLPNQEFAEFIEAVKKAHIQIYENCWMERGYVNKVMTVLWNEYFFEPEDVFIWQDGNLISAGSGEPYWQTDDRTWHIAAKLYNKLTNELIPRARYFLRSLFLSQTRNPF
jgi:hypothetical protein